MYIFTCAYELTCLYMFVFKASHQCCYCRNIIWNNVTQLFYTIQTVPCSRLGNRAEVDMCSYTIKVLWI